MMQADDVRLVNDAYDAYAQTRPLGAAVAACYPIGRCLRSGQQMDGTSLQLSMGCS
jgi:hypothetical protein